MKRVDMLAMLAEEEDFKNQRIWLLELLEDAGMEVDFFPKFHCEFNWIERYWGNVKCNVRKQCDYTFTNLERTVPQCLDAVSKLMLRKFARKSLMLIDTKTLKAV